MTVKAGILLVFLPVALVGARGTCPSNEAISLLRMEKIVGEWNGTHFSGNNNDCSLVQVSALTEGQWRLRRTSTINGNITDIILQQPDRSSGRLEAVDANGNNLKITVLAADYDSHILMQECTTGNATTIFLQRRATNKKLDEDTNLITALYDLNIPPRNLRLCRQDAICKKWPTVVPELDERKLSGVWRESGRIRVSGLMQRRSCAYLTVQSTGDGLSVQYSYDNNGNTACVLGTAKYKYPDTKRGILMLSGADMSGGELWILDTNYVSYALVSLCIPTVQSHASEGGVLVLTRSGTLTSADAFAINAALISAGKNNVINDINPGFNRLDSMLDIAPQNCDADPVTCGAKFTSLSSFLLCVLTSMLLLCR